MDVWNKLSSYLSGEDVEESPEQIAEKERLQKKLSMLSRNQRVAALEDLKNSMRELFQFITENEKVPGKLSTMESTDDAKRLILNDDMSLVTIVCNNIDRCCSHGLRRVEGDENNFVKFFGLLKWTCARLAARQQQRMAEGIDDAGSSKFSNQAVQLATSSLAPEMPREMRGFMACVRTSSGLSNVETDEGRARAFIRQTLNIHIFQSCIRAVVDASNTDLLTSYYTEYALFRQKDEVDLFLSLLDGMDALSFGFGVNDPRLDMAPETLPFATPLPVPQPAELVKTAPELIEPEDMIDGRVRLSSADNNNGILAEKLLEHRHLGSNFNKTEGGNPLASILKKTQATHALDDVFTSVMRFLEIGLPEFDVFGSPLVNSVCNPFLCGMARFDASMGIPDVVEACICYLHKKLSTPGLFQVHLAAEHIIDLRDAIEELGGFHKSMAIDPHEVVAILMQYLWELPEPLLTEDRWDAFIACGKIEDNEQKLLHVKLLVNDLPWSHKPLLERLLHLMGRALQPEFSQRSGVTSHMLALLLSPLILRSGRRFRFTELDEASFRRFPVAGHTPVRRRLPLDFYGEPSTYEAQQAAAEAKALRQAKQQAEEGALILDLLLNEQHNIMNAFRKELSTRRQNLQKKVMRMESLRHRLSEKIDLQNSTHVALLKHLWDGLLPSDATEAVEIVSGSDENHQTIDIQALLKSKRWKLSGFHTEDPMGGFRGGGLLSLQCLVYFVHEYPAKAKLMMEQNAQPGGTRYPFPVAAINVMRMMMTLLMVDEAPATPSRLILHSETGLDTVLQLEVAERVSRSPFWRVFDDAQAFEKLHSMAFMILDLHWTRSGATQMGFGPVLDATRQQMGWLLERAPKNVNEMWKDWMQAREQKASTIRVALPATNQSDWHGDELAEHMRVHMTRTMSSKQDSINEDCNNQVVDVSELSLKEGVLETSSTASTASASPSKDEALEWRAERVF